MEYSYNNTWFNNTETFYNFKYIDIRELIANHASRLLWGNGFILSSPIEKVKNILEQVDETNNLLSFFYKVEKILSVFGFSVVTINKTIKDKIILGQSSPYALSRIAYITDTPLAAQVWQKIKYDDGSNGFLKTTYTKNTIEREWLTENKDVIVGDKISKIPEEYNLPRKEIHNLGFIPVIFIQNVPKKNNWLGTTVGQYYSDLTPTIGLQKLLDFTFSSLNHELEFNRTRVFANLSPYDMAQAQLESLSDEKTIFTSASDYQKIKRWTSDFIIRGTEGVPGTSEFNILEGKPNEIYLKILDWTIAAAYEGAGYSYKESEAKDSTATELMLSKSNDHMTTKFKRALRTRQYKTLFWKILHVLGFNNISRDDIIFEIKEHLIIDEMKKMEITNRKITMGLSSRIREIQKIEGVSYHDATKIKEEIDKENENDNIYLDNQLEQQERALNDSTHSNIKDKESL